MSARSSKRAGTSGRHTTRFRSKKIRVVVPRSLYEQTKDKWKFPSSKTRRYIVHYLKTNVDYKLIRWRLLVITNILLTYFPVEVKALGIGLIYNYGSARRYVLSQIHGERYPQTTVFTIVINTGKKRTLIEGALEPH